MVNLVSSFATAPQPRPSAQTVDDVVRDLVRQRRSGGATFVNLPMLYPDGSSVTVRIDRGPNGLRVSDAGFAFREADDMGLARSFRRTANRLADEAGVQANERLIFAEASIETLESVIRDVAAVSWRVADLLATRAEGEEDVQLSDELSARLKNVFRESNVETGAELLGNSTTSWPVTALVKVDGRRAVFQAVSDHPHSINKASTAFRDLSGLEHAPSLVAFVRTRRALGPKLALLAPGRVVEEAQGDDVLARAA